MGKKGLTIKGGHRILRLSDGGGRRLGEDRRKMPLLCYEPERRSWSDRRMNQDRRIRKDQGEIDLLRRDMDRYMEFANANKGITTGAFLSLGFWAMIATFLIFKFWS